MASGDSKVFKGWWTRTALSQKTLYSYLTVKLHRQNFDTKIKNKSKRAGWQDVKRTLPFPKLHDSSRASCAPGIGKASGGWAGKRRSSKNLLQFTNELCPGLETVAFSPVTTQWRQREWAVTAVRVTGHQPSSTRAWTKDKAPLPDRVLRPSEAPLQCDEKQGKKRQGNSNMYFLRVVIGTAFSF